MKLCRKCGVEKQENDFYAPRGNGAISSPCKKCKIQTQQAYSKRFPKKKTDYYKWHHIEKSTGLTKQDWHSLLSDQGGCCALCDVLNPVRPVVDHCHKTGKIRGIICHKCNVGIGQMGDDPVHVGKALGYLLRHLESN